MLALIVPCVAPPTTRPRAIQAAFVAAALGLTLVLRWTVLGGVSLEPGRASLNGSSTPADRGSLNLAYLGSVVRHKGVHLIQHAMFYTLERGGQFVLLGAGGDRGINNHFWHLKHYLNDNSDCHMEIGFNEQLAHLIYAGADICIVPSLFEPCGLTQMIAMRYGTVPLVRAVGGLVDTVFDRDNSDKPLEQRNGYVFKDADFRGIESALGRAIGLWGSYPKEFRRLISNGMAMDFSWASSGQHYIDVYNHIRCK